MSSGAKAKSYGPLVQCSEESCLEKLFNKTGMERKQLCLRGLWTRVLPILKKILWQKQKICHSIDLENSRIFYQLDLKPPWLRKIHLKNIFLLPISTFLPIQQDWHNS